MFNFPFWGYPYNNPYYRYYNKPRNYVDIQENQGQNPNSNQSTEQNIEQNTTQNVQRGITSLDNNNKKDNPVFEIFGIKLYSDDLIILAVLFLLYEQNVKDEMLYIILFLLLVS